MIYCIIICFIQSTKFIVMGHNKTDTDEDLEKLKEYLDQDDGHEVERQQQLIHGLWSGTTDLQLPEDTPSGQVKIEDLNCQIHF